MPHILKGEEYKSNIIFTTQKEQEESEKVENMTVKEITAIVFEKLELREDKQLLLDIYKKEVRNKNKEKLVNFYNTLLETETESEQGC